MLVRGWYRPCGHGLTSVRQMSTRYCIQKTLVAGTCAAQRFLVAFFMRRYVSACRGGTGAAQGTRAAQRVGGLQVGEGMRAKRCPWRCTTALSILGACRPQFHTPTEQMRARRDTLTKARCVVGQGPALNRVPPQRDTPNPHLPVLVPFPCCPMCPLPSQCHAAP